MANFVPRDGTQSNLGRTDKPWGTAWVNVIHGTADAALRSGTSTTAENLSGTAPYAIGAGTWLGWNGTASAFSGTAIASLTAGTAQAAILFSGTAPYALVAGTVYGMGTGTSSGTGDYATLAGTAINFSGTAPAATQAGTAQWAPLSGTASRSTTAGTSDFSVIAGTAIYALSGGTGGPAVGGTADFAAVAGTALQFFGTAGYATNSGLLSGTAATGFISRRVSDDTKEPTGFPNRTDTTMAFTDATRLFTISGAHAVYSQGTLFSKSAGTLTINATPGFNFVFYGTTGDLSQVQGFPGFDQCLVASVYYNGTKGLLADERHGIIMDSATHEYLHDTVRTRYESGLAGTFGDTSFSLSAGTIADEDLEVGLPQQGTCQVLYRRAGVWDWTTPQGSYYYSSGGNIFYDNAGTIAAVTGNQFSAYWIFATADASCPILSLMGQRQDVTLASARANNTPDALSLTSLPYNEMKLLYRVILKNDATPYEEVADYRNVSSLPVNAYVSTDHLTLLNIGKYKHTEIDAFIDGSQVGTAQFATISGTALNFFGTATAALTAGTAQTALTFGGTATSALTAGTAQAALTFSGTAPYALGAGTWLGWNGTASAFSGTAPAAVRAGTATTAENMSGTAAYAIASGSWWGWNGTASAFSGTAPAAVRAGTATTSENFSGTAIAATNSGTANVANYVSYASGVIYAGSAITLPSSNLTASGLMSSQTVGQAVGFGNVLFMGSDLAWYLADSDGASTMPAMAMALGTCGSAASCKMLHYGWVRNDAWSFTVGGFAWPSTTAGSLRGTAPTGSGDQAQVAGVAYGTGLLFFCPSPVLVEIA